MYLMKHRQASNTNVTKKSLKCESYIKTAYTMVEMLDAGLTGFDQNAAKLRFVIPPPFAIPEPFCIPAPFLYSRTFFVFPHPFCHSRAGGNPCSVASKA